MPASKRASSKRSSAAKVRRHRANLRAQGLRPIQIWVPDVNDPKISAQLRREAKLIAQSAQEKDDLAFIASLWDDAFFER